MKTFINWLKRQYYLRKKWKVGKDIWGEETPVLNMTEMINKEIKKRGFKRKKK